MPMGKGNINKIEIIWTFSQLLSQVGQEYWIWYPHLHINSEKLWSTPWQIWIIPFKIETKLKILLEVLRAKYILVDIENIQTLFWDDQIIFAESRIILLIHPGDAARPLIHNKWVILPQYLHLQIPAEPEKWW